MIYISVEVPPILCLHQAQEKALNQNHLMMMVLPKVSGPSSGTWSKYCLDFSTKGVLSRKTARLTT